MAYVMTDLFLAMIYVHFEFIHVVEPLSLVFVCFYIIWVSHIIFFHIKLHISISWKLIILIIAKIGMLVFVRNQSSRRLYY